MGAGNLTSLDDSTPPSVFQKVDTFRASETIARHIRGLIRNGELQAGQRLPSERELCERMGVSRVTLREALRILEATGLIQSRVGSRGGTIVSVPTSVYVGEGLTDMLAMSGLSSSNITELRRVLEIGILPVVAARADDDDYEELLSLCDEATTARRQGEYSVGASFDFHLRLAEATHNPAIAMLMRSLREPILRSLVDAHHEGAAGADEHRQLVHALRVGNTTSATEILDHHLDRTADKVSGDRRE